MTPKQVNNRLARLRQQLTGKEVDGIIISRPENRYYLSGFESSTR